MGFPIWKTNNFDLGTIKEREFFQFRLVALDSDTGANTPIFSVIAGELPQGISVKATGVIEGTAQKKSVSLQGVPLDVGQDEVSRFAVRATSTSGIVSDRTFTVTVSGQDQPQIVGNTDLGTHFFGEYFEAQLEAVDLDADDVLTWSLQSGQLPVGLTLSPTGLIRGYIEPVREQLVKEYSFVVNVTDGKDFDVQSYTMTANTRIIGEIV
jgi:hypothetical protein